METLENRLKREIRAYLKFDQEDKSNIDDFDIGWNKGWNKGRISLLRELLSEEQYQAMEESVIQEMEEE